MFYNLQLAKILFGGLCNLQWKKMLLIVNLLVNLKRNFKLCSLNYNRPICMDTDESYKMIYLSKPQKIITYKNQIEEKHIFCN